MDAGPFAPRQSAPGRGDRRRRRHRRRRDRRRRWLVPITRAFLARYYDKYPLPPLSDDASTLAAQLRGLSADLALDEEILAQEACTEPAHKLMRICGRTESKWKKFYFCSMNLDVPWRYDIHATGFSRHLNQTTARALRISKQAEVEALVSAGGSICDRYALLWKQQMERFGDLHASWIFVLLSTF